MTTTRHRLPAMPALPPLRPVCIAIALLAALPAGRAAPTGAVLAGGQASVRVTAPGQMEIVQTTPRATLDWTNFSIAAGERVNVAQPDSRSVLLNRVLGDNPSLIYGSLTANGSVWLVNPRGIVFGAGSRVDVGSLVATTLAITNEDLASGRLQLGAGAGGVAGAGALRSEGQITATDGSVVLVAPNLVHSGQITARRVGLAAASEVLVDVEGDGLVFFNARNDQLDARLQLLGGVRADGGTAEIRAAARAGFADTVLNLDGVVQARSLGRREGRIVIDGGTSGNTIVAGKLEATGAAEGERGGSITVLGHNVGLAEGALLDASGSAGGGSVRVGGDYQGGNPELHNAARVSVTSGARIAADATTAGDGGRVIVWADDITRFGGSVTARGGAAGGDGGFAEVSGKGTLSFAGTVDLTAPRGLAGTLLLDPDTITITDLAGAVALPGRIVDFTDSGNADSFFTKGSLNGLLGSGNVSLSAKSTITVSSNGPAVSGSGKLTLKAGGDIVIDTSISAAGGIDLSAADTAPAATTSATGHVRLASGATLDAGSATLSISSNNGSKNTLSGNLAAGTLTLVGGATIPDSPASVQWTLTGDSTIAGTVDGSGTLVKTGAGKLGFVSADATAKIATGTLSITGGSVELTSGSTDRIAAGTVVRVGSGGKLSVANTGEGLGTLALNGGLVDGAGGLAVATFTSDGASQLENTVTTSTSASVATGVLSLGNGGTTGALGGTAIDIADGAELNVNRSGLASTLALPTLTGAGTLRVTSGAVSLDNTASALKRLAVDGGSLALDSGQANLGSAAVVSVGSSGTLTLGDTDEAVTSLALSGTLARAGGSTAKLSATTYTLSGGTANAPLGAGTLLSSGSSQLNAAVAATTLTVNGGTLSLGAANLLAAGATVNVAQGATLSQGGDNTITALNLGGTISGAALAATTVTLAGPAPRIEAAITAPLAVTSGITLTIGTGGSVSGDITLADATSRLIFDSTGPVSAGNVLGSGHLEQHGTGTLTLDGTASGLATLDVTRGTLAFGAAPGARLGSGTAVSVSTGAQLTLGGTAETVGSLDLGGTLAGAAALGATSYTLRGGSVVGTALSGGALSTVSGTAQLNAASILDSVAVVSGSTLQLGADSSTGTAQIGGTLSGGHRLDVTSTTAGSALLKNGASIATGTTLAGAAGVELQVEAGATATLDGRAAFDNVRVLGGSTLVLGAGAADRLADTGDVILAAGGTLQLASNERIRNLSGSGSLSGAGTLTTDLLALNGSTVSAPVTTSALTSDGVSAIHAAVQVNGTASVDTGTLTVGDGATAGSLAATSGVTVAGGATLAFRRSDDISLASNVSGAGTLNKLGAGKLTLGGQATTTAVQVSAGILALADGSGTRIGDGSAVTVATGSTLQLGNQAETIGTLDLTGTLAGSPALSATSYTLRSGAIAGGPLSGGALSTVSGTAQLNAASSLASIGIASGSTLQLGADTSATSATIAGTLAGAARTLSLSGSATLNTGANVGALLNAATVNVPGTASLTGAGRLAAGTALSINGGTLNLGGAESVATLSLGTGGILAGSATLSTGTLLAGSNGTLNAPVSATTVQMAGSDLAGSATLAAATLDAGAGGSSGRLALDTTAAAFSGSGGLTLGGRTLTADVSAPSASFAGSFTGTGRFVKQGTGTLTLNASHDHGGGTTVSAGVLALGATGALPTGGDVTVDGGATLTLAAAGSVRSLVLAGTLAGAGSLATTAGATLQTGASVTGTLGGNSVDVTGNSSVSGSITAGAVNVNGGQLTLAAGGDRLDNNAAVSVAGGATLALSADERIGSLALAGHLLSVTAPGSFFTLTTGSGSTLNSGAVVDANLAGGNITVTGNTLLNASVASPQLTISGGQLSLGATAGHIADTSAVLLTGGILALAADETVASLDLAGTISGAARLTTTGTATLRGGAVVAADLGAGQLQMLASLAGDPAATVTGRAFVGSVAVDRGTLSLVGGGRLATVPALTVAAPGRLQLSGAETVSSLTLDGALAGSGSLTSTGTAALNGASVGAALTAPLLTSAGSSSITAAVSVPSLQIGSGTLTLGIGGALSGAPQADVANNATLALAADQTLSALSGTGTVTLSGATLILQPVGNASFDGLFDGSGNFDKRGSGTFTFNAAQNYSGSTTVRAGTLATAGAGRLPDASDVTVLTGAILAPGSNDTVRTLTLNGGTLAGSATLSASAGYTLAGGTVAAGAALGAGTLTSSGNSSIAGTAGAGSVTVTGGTLTLAGSQRLTANPDVTVAGGSTLQLQGAQTVQTLDLSGTLDEAGRTLTALTGVTLHTGALARADLVAPRLDVDGDATLAGTFTGSTSTAPLAITAGTLTLPVASRLGAGTDVTVAGVATLALGGNETVHSLTLSGGLTGGTALLTAPQYTLRGSADVAARLGAGTLDVGVANTAGTVRLAASTGARTVNLHGGTLQLAAGGSLDSLAVVDVQGSARLTLGVAGASVGSLTLAGILDGSGGLSSANDITLAGGTVNVDISSTTLTSGGSSQLNGRSNAHTVTVSGGTLALGAAGRLLAAPEVSIDPGATLALGGAETFGTLAGGGTLGLGSATLTTGNGGNSSFSGVIGGSGSLVKAGVSTFTLGGASTYTGSTLVQGGTLQLDGTLRSPTLQLTGGRLVLGAADRLIGTAPVNVTVGTGATLSLDATQTIEQLDIAGTLAGTGTLTARRVVANGATITANLGAGQLQSTGTSSLAGLAALGSVAVDGGTLTLVGAERLSAMPTVNVASSATLQLGGNETFGSLDGAGNVVLGDFALSTGSGGSSRFDGVLSGLRGSLRKEGAASTFTLGGANTYGGTTTVAEGTLAAATGGVLPSGTTLDVVTDAFYTLGGNQTVLALTLSGTLSGSGTLTARNYTLASGTASAALGTGRLNASGTSRLDASVLAQDVHVDGGTLRVASGVLAADATVTVNSGATLALGGANHVAALALSGTVSGTTRLTADAATLDGGTVAAPLGGNTLNSSGASRIEADVSTRTVQVDAGQLTLAAGSQLAANADLTVLAGATLQMGPDLAIGTLALAGTLAGNATLNAASYALDGAIVNANLGRGSLSSGGASLLAGTAGADTLAVNAGTLVLAAADRLTQQPITTVAGGATLELRGATALGSLAGAGTVDLGANALATGSAGDSRFDGVLQGTGGSLRKLGGSTTFTLGGDNGYTGATTVEAGTLATAAAERLPNASALSVADGATLRLGGDEQVKTLALSGTLAGSAKLSADSYILDGGTADANLGAGTLTSRHTSRLNGSSDAASVTIDSGELRLGSAERLSDAAALTIVRGSTLRLSGDEHVRTAVIRGTLAGSGVLTASTYNLDGATLNADIGGGGLIISSDTLLAARTNAETVTVQAGTLTLADAGRFNASPTVTLGTSGELRLGGNETIGQLAGEGRVELGGFVLSTGSTGSSRYDGVIAGAGSLVKQGSSTFTLGGTQTYTGATVVEAGTLALAGTLASPVLRVAGGTLALGAAERLVDGAVVSVEPGAAMSLAGDETIGSLNLAGILSGSGRLSAGSYSLFSGTVTADLGSGTLRTNGASRLDGTAATGTVEVLSGRLVLGSADRLTAAPALTVAAGARLQLLGGQTLGTLAGAGTVDLGSFQLATGSGGDSRFDGIASGSGSLVKQGSSSFTLAGANSYTGPTRIEAGTLVLAAGDRLGDTTAVDVAGGATLDIGSFTDTVGSLNLVGRLVGSGTLSATSYTLAGGTAVANLGAGALFNTADSRLEGTAAVSTVDVNGGTLLLASADRLTQRPAVNVAANATLRLAGEQTLGTLAGAGTVDTGGLQLATGIGGDSRFDGSLAGGGTLLKQGSGRFVLGGTAAAARMQVDAGTLELAAAERLADTTAVGVAGGATLALNGNETVKTLELAGNLSGTGTLSAESYALAGGTALADLGTGTLVSRGASRLAGTSAADTVTVADGSLTLGAANRLADTAAVSVATGATLALDAADTVASLALSGTLAGSGTLTAARVVLDGGTANANLGAGALVSRNTSTLAGNAASTTVTVETGRLLLASANRFGATPAVNVAGGAALVLGGDQAFGTLAGAGELGLGAFTLSTGSGGDSTFSGVVSGSGGLVKQGSSSIFTLTGASSYTGATRVAAGTLRLGDGGTLATSRFDLDGTLVFAHGDELRVPQPIAGAGGVEQAGSGRLVFSGANKSFTGQTLVSSGELATQAAGDLAPASAVRVAAGGRLTLAARETVRALDADGSVALGGDLTATQDLVMHGAVNAPGDVKLVGQRIVADSTANRFAGTLSLDAGGAITLNAGLDGSSARPLTLGTVNAAAGGRIEAGTIALTNATNVNGGTLELVSAADPVPVQPVAELLGRQAVGLQIAFASDAVAQQGDASRITVAQGAGLAITASRGGSVQLLTAGNSFLGSLSVVSGQANTPWQANSTSAPFGGTVAMQARVRIEGTTINVGGAGLVADVLDIRADRLATVGDTATLVARLPFDSTAGSAVSLPAMTLSLTPEAFNIAFPFGSAGAANGLRVDIGSRGYGQRTLPLDAGYVTVLPRGGARGATAVLLSGPVVNPFGGYRFFFDGAGVQGEIPVFYNGVLPNTPAVENSISATVAVSEGARKDRFEEAVRTENVAVRLRAGVIAEVGPAPSATQGTEGIRVPLTCPPAAGLLSCGGTR